MNTFTEILERPTVLIVDDAPENLSVLSELLTPQYRVLAATSGASCLDIALGPAKPDLILLDVVMPGMDGYTVLTRLREHGVTRDIPVIFLTTLSDSESEERGLQMGAADYVTKPIRAAILLARVRAQLDAKLARDWLKDQNVALETEVARRMAENNLVRKASIHALAHLAETRDTETGHHIARTQYYVQRLAMVLASHPRFSNTLDPHYIEQLVLSAPLHDIGKVGIPDSILLKPGPLTKEEWDIMRTHASKGSNAIELAERDIEAKVEFLTMAKEIARWHHEKWDGTGYPDRLAGNAIPVSARLMALADVFDALISDRPYKRAMTFSQARDIIASERGKHFDADVVDAFLTHFDEFVEIADNHQEHGEHRRLS